MLLFVLQMHWDFDMYIRNRVDTSPSPVAWSSMCKQLFGFIGFMLVMFYLGQKFRVYQPVVSTNQLFLFICLFTFFLSFLRMWCKPLSSVCFTIKHVWQWSYLWWHKYILKVQCVNFLRKPSLKNGSARWQLTRSKSLAPCVFFRDATIFCILPNRLYGSIHNGISVCFGHSTLSKLVCCSCRSLRSAD